MRHKGSAIYLSQCNETLASMAMKQVCALSIQALANLIISRWVYTVALDMSTHQCVPILDIRNHFEHQGKIGDFHFVALPVRALKHTTLVIKSLYCEFMDAFFSGWESKQIDVYTDGARSMAGRAAGFATRLPKDVPSGFMRTWCGSHQVDLAVKKALKKLMRELFIRHMTRLIAFLRRSRNLISSLSEWCLDYSKKRWLSLGRGG
ncbi:hypothetical protein XU18_3095 [Perkinsela sp. CCAP 1560/4]|nr:hypothetical protein XU18_3095 [Perkinsela sp. CCAP 1560/4]|eukprot:KNH05933.1 hypothetical protein XU18_3095 [Perkinsela sp. CCAP 1560/4]